MISNERGFIFPFTLCILILFSTFLTINLEQFLAEKRFLIDIENNLDREYYFTSALMEVEALLNNESFNELSGSIAYSEANVDYTIQALSATLLQITFTMNLNGNGGMQGIAYYDKDVKKMVKWVEKQ